MRSTISLAVVDDHPLFREGVARSLAENQQFKVVGEGGNCEEAVRLVSNSHPDVLLLDISMPGGGLAAIAEILKRAPDQKIIMLTVSESRDDLVEALDRGAKGYVLKGIGSRGLADVVKIVADGGGYVDPGLSARLLSKSAAEPEKAVDRLSTLTLREREVLELVAEGMSNKVIAIKLDLMEKTVKHHMTQILAKLGLTNRTEAALALRDAIGKVDINRSVSSAS